MKSVELLLSQRKTFYEGTEMIIRGIKSEWFNTKPFDEAMTFGEQIDHISSVEADILDETASALEFDTIPFDFKPSENLDNAISQWKRIHKLGDDFISRLSDEDLSFRFMTVSHVHMSVHQMINAVLEHEIHHRGELIAYFRIMKVEPPKRWQD
jgi:uncharacterized damage-inducible protein DinB